MRLEGQPMRILTNFPCTKPVAGTGDIVVTMAPLCADRCVAGASPLRPTEFGVSAGDGPMGVDARVALVCIHLLVLVRAHAASAHANAQRVV